MRKFGQRAVLTAVAVSAGLALLAGCGEGKPAAPTLTPTPSPTASIPAQTAGDVVLTVDGYDVTTEEFRLFLQDERALTAAHFMSAYNATADEGFWDRAFDGQTPNEYAREAALQKLLTAKMEAILCKERGLAEDISYAAFLADLERENADRADKQEKGEVFYGLAEYDAATYYAYVRSNRWGELLRSQRGYVSPTEAELRELYDEEPGYFTGAAGYRCTFRYADGAQEEQTISYDTVHKEDVSGAGLLALLEEAEPGATIAGAGYDGKIADVTLLEIIPGETVPFEDESAQATLRGLYEEKSLRELLARRIAEAEVEIDQEAYAQMKIG